MRVTGATALWLAAALALGGAGGACARARASVEPVMPVLTVPPPPPRVLPPLEEEPLDASAAVPNEPQSAPRQPSRPRPDTSRNSPNGSARNEGRSEAAPPPPDGSPQPDEASQSPPSLQIASPGDTASEQSTRRRLTQAAQNLQRVDYRLLNTDAKAQYDIAKRFIALAEQAITDRNLLYARTLADKAATIAGVLQRR